MLWRGIFKKYVKKDVLHGGEYEKKQNLLNRRP